jgi:hypothetical protein
MITKTFQKSIADFMLNKISVVKLIVNDQEREAVIKNKQVFNNYMADIYVDVSFTSSSDILNGIKFYDGSGVLLAQDLPNLSYNVQQATYLYRLNVLSNKEILE